MIALTVVLGSRSALTSLPDCRPRGSLGQSAPFGAKQQPRRRDPFRREAGTREARPCPALVCSRDEHPRCVGDFPWFARIRVRGGEASACYGASISLPSINERAGPRSKRRWHVSGSDAGSSEAPASTELAAPIALLKRAAPVLLRPWRDQEQKSPGGYPAGVCFPFSYRSGVQVGDQGGSCHADRRRGRR